MIVNVLSAGNVSSGRVPSTSTSFCLQTDELTPEQNLRSDSLDAHAFCFLHHTCTRSPLLLHCVPGRLASGLSSGPGASGIRRGGGLAESAWGPPPGGPHCGLAWFSCLSSKAQRKGDGELKVGGGVGGQFAISGAGIAVFPCALSLYIRVRGGGTRQHRAAFHFLVYTTPPPCQPPTLGAIRNTECTHLLSNDVFPSNVMLFFWGPVIISGLRYRRQDCYSWGVFTNGCICGQNAFMACTLLNILKRIQIIQQYFPFICGTRLIPFDLERSSLPCKIFLKLFSGLSREHLTVTHNSCWQHVWKCNKKKKELLSTCLFKSNSITIPSVFCTWLHPHIKLPYSGFTFNFS